MRYLIYATVSALALASGCALAGGLPHADEHCDAVCELRFASDAGMAAAIAFEMGMNSGKLAPLIKTQGLLRYACDLGSISNALDEPIRIEVDSALEAQLGGEDRYASSTAARRWAIAEQVHQGFVFGYSMGFASANTARFKSAGSTADQEHEQQLTCAAATRFANSLLDKQR